MRITLKVDDAESLKKLEGLSVDEYMEAWAEVVGRLARANARNRFGNGKFAGMVLKDIRTETFPGKATVEAGKVGTHAHFGGPIQSSKGKVLAIPTRWNTSEDFAHVYGDNYFVVLRSKRNNRAYLFKRPGEGERLGRPQFVLTPKTKPQRPRPWWPEQAEAEAATKTFFDRIFGV